MEAIGFSKERLGYNSVGCVVRVRDHENYTQWTDWKTVGRLIFQVISNVSLKPEYTQRGHATRIGFDIAHAAVSFKSKEQLIVSSINGQCYAVGNGEAGMGSRIVNQTQGEVLKLKTISDTRYDAG